uniref:Uncharacterized protein n=1 Tax=Cacopsylla melanoneura TaxID=428564 RepID=A0A8D8TKT9_9HEMI
MSLFNKINQRNRMYIETTDLYKRKWRDRILYPQANRSQKRRETILGYARIICKAHGEVGAIVSVPFLSMNLCVHFFYIQKTEYPGQIFDEYRVYFLGGEEKIP